MKKHFLKKENPENKIRFIIYQLMNHFEGMDSIMNQLLSFELHEVKALDKIEEHLIEMEKLHLDMTKLVKNLEKENTVGEEIVFESSRTSDAVRRTNNMVSVLNKVDLNSDSWVSILIKCLIDRIYYRHIKALVYKSSEDLPE